MPTIYNKVTMDGTTYMDISDTTATESDVAQGKYFYAADGTKRAGAASGGSTPTLVSKTISTNGSYAASDDSADGYSSVTVNVPTGITPTGTKEVSISANGVTTEDVTNYASARITVNVSGGGTPSATRHTLYFEFEDGTNQTVYAYYDDAFIGSAITATRPTTKDNKTVTLAQLDGVTWYSYDPTAIPLNTQLIDFSKVQQGYVVNGDDGSADANEYGAMCDYTKIDPSMTFTYIGYRWWNLAFYDASKVYIDSVYMDSDADSKDEYDNAHGTLTPSKIPSNAVYVRISAMANYDDYDGLSLIRTA